MSSIETYTPGPANAAHIEKDADKWKLVVVKELRHSPDKVWSALTDPTQLREWAPFDATGNLGTVGATLKLSTYGAPAEHTCETKVTRADAPHALEYKWGDFDMRWQLEPTEKGTRLTLWTNIPKAYIAMGAAGWQVCFDVLDLLLDGTPIGRLSGPDAMKFEGWQRLHKEYSEKFGVEMPKW